MTFLKPKSWKAHITKQRTIAKNTIEISLWLDGGKFVFYPGQYIKVSLPHLLLTDEKGGKRDFSISSSPIQGNLITFAFRVSESAFKQSLVSSHEGSLVDLQGPLGVFTLPDDPSLPVVFVAGGIGIAPFLSMIRYATEQKLPTQITLLYANNSPESAAYLPELEMLAKQNNHFVLIKKYGSLEEMYIRQNLSESINAHWYIAGPPGMVLTTRNILLTMWVPEEKIITEEFSGYDTANKKIQPVEEENKEIEKVSTFRDLQLPNVSLEAVLTALNDTALVSTTDRDGTITYVNDKFAEISKHSKEELLGNNHRILKSGHHPQSFYDNMWHNYLLKGKTWRGEIKNRAKDGTFYWVDSSITPIFDTAGKTTGYFAVRFPITKKKSFEESLLLYSNILKQTKQAWGMADLNGKLIDMNSSFEELLGYSRNELFTMNYTHLITNTDRQKIQIEVQEAMRMRKSFSTTAVFQKKDESLITIALTVNSYWEGDVPKYIFAFLTDITEENTMIQESEKTNFAMLNILEDARVLEEKLQDEQVRLTTILSTMGEGLFVIDANSTVVLMNETAQKILEIPIQNASGKPSRDAFPMLLKNGKIATDEERPSVQVIKTGKNIVGLLSDNYQYQLSSGRKINIALIATPMKDNNGVVEGAVVIFRDITDEKKLDDTRETFISIASHQLRTPLTSIRWYTEMLAAGDAGALTDPQKGFVNNIYVGVLRLSETLNMLLSLSRVESGRIKKEPEDVNLVALTEDVVKELTPYSHAKNLKIAIALEETENATVTIDPSMARQVIINLISNAIRYTENKTTIQVTIKPKTDHWLYSVADKGIGISEENKSRIFEKFFRTDNAVALVPDGNGLGLTLVKDLVELWDGKVWFDSELGKGSTFYFTIPFKGMEEKSEGKSLS